MRIRPGARWLALCLLALVFACGRNSGCCPAAGGGAAESGVAAPAGASTAIARAGRQRWPAAGAERPAAAHSGRVVRVVDGDSIVVLLEGAEVEVRLESIDAPELAQAFGRKAKRATADLAFGRDVHLETGGRDKYGRVLAEVFLPDGRSLNRELVRTGFAWWFRRYSPDRTLEALEREARAARRGLWADENPVPPWEFRERNPRR